MGIFKTYTMVHNLQMMGSASFHILSCSQEHALVLSPHTELLLSARTDF